MCVSNQIPPYFILLFNFSDFSKDMTNIRLWLHCVGLQEDSAKQGLPLPTAEFLSLEKVIMFTQGEAFS